jgi:hypothetical protein
MGEVTNVRWNCPGCGEPNISQIYGFWDDETYEDGALGLEHTEIPFKAASLKWEPPCKKCAQYRLTEPDYLVTLPIVKVATYDRKALWDKYYKNEKGLENPIKETPPTPTK